jgi:proline- and glutamine-rich splicing factor
MASNRLFVENIDSSATSDEITKLFARYGNVLQVSLIGIRGSAVVEMSKQSEAKKAKRELNGSMFKGNKLELREARSVER